MVKKFISKGHPDVFLIIDDCVVFCGFQSNDLLALNFQDEVESIRKSDLESIQTEVYML